MSRRARLLQLFFFFAALLVLFWLLNKTGWSNIGHALMRVGPSGALILVALGFSETILDTLAAAIAIRQRRWGQVLVVNNAGALLNQILPFDLGEVVKGALTHRLFPSERTIAGTIVWNYVFKISRPLVILTAAVIGIVGAPQVDTKVRYLVLAGAFVSFLPYVILRLVLRHGVAVMFVRLLSFVRILRGDPSRILNKALTIDTTVASFWRERPRIRRDTIRADRRSPGVVVEPVRDVALDWAADRLQCLRAALCRDEHRRPDHHDHSRSSGCLRGSGVRYLQAVRPSARDRRDHVRRLSHQVARDDRSPGAVRVSRARPAATAAPPAAGAPTAADGAFIPPASSPPQG